ncbi:MAG: hypothetical protein ACOC38_08795 [Promethearchaeia archaeon]
MQRDKSKYAGMALASAVLIAIGCAIGYSLLAIQIWEGQWVERHQEFSIAFSSGDPLSLNTTGGNTTADVFLTADNDTLTVSWNFTATFLAVNGSPDMFFRSAIDYVFPDSNVVTNHTRTIVLLADAPIRRWHRMSMPGHPVAGGGYIEGTYVFNNSEPREHCLQDRGNMLLAPNTTLAQSNFSCQILMDLTHPDFISYSFAPASVVLSRFAPISLVMLIGGGAVVAVIVIMEVLEKREDVIYRRN